MLKKNPSGFQVLNPDTPVGEEALIGFKERTFVFAQLQLNRHQRVQCNMKVWSGIAGRLQCRYHVAGCFMCRQPQQKSGSRQPRSSQHQHHTEAQGPQPPCLQYLSNRINQPKVIWNQTIWFEDIANIGKFNRKMLDADTTAGKTGSTSNSACKVKYFFILNWLNTVSKRLTCFCFLNKLVI